MLLPVIPNSLPRIESPQSATEPARLRKSEAEDKVEDKVEDSQFEDFLSWFQSQTIKVESAPVPALDASFDSPGAGVEQETLGLINETLVPPVDPGIPANLKTASTSQALDSDVQTTLTSTPPPTITQPGIELSEDNLIESADASAVTEEVPVSITDVESSTTVDSTTNSESSLRLETFKVTTQNELTVPVESEVITEIAADHMRETNNSEVNLTIKSSNDVVESSFIDVVKSASKPAQTVTQQVAEQTLAQLANSSGKQESSVTVRLDPPELGEVLVSLKKSEGGIIMRIAAVEKSTQALLQLNEVDLSQSMADHQGEITMEFGSQSDFENSRFNESHTRGALTRNRLGENSNSPRSMVRTSSLLEQSVHNFTA